MDLSIIGAGHVGLVTGACFAEKGHTVVCVDNNASKIDALKSGRVPFYEPGLAEMVRRNVEAERLEFSTSIAKAVDHGRAIFISVWTPPLPSGRADLSHIEKVSRAIGETLPEGRFRLIVEKSTVPVKTGERVLTTLQRTAPPGADYEVASNPEFLREGTAVHDALNPDRIVFGVESSRARETLERIYEGFPGKRLFSDVKSAEMIKHASNAFLATKISFINSVARLCEKTGADVETVAQGLGMDPRISPDFLKAGIGFGGECLPKDLSAFIDIAREHGVAFPILEAVGAENYRAWSEFVEKVDRELRGVSGKRLALLGLSFKPNTDDMRMAPSLKIIEDLVDRGATVRIWDPVALEAAAKAMAGLLEEHGGWAKDKIPDPGSAAAGKVRLWLVVTLEEAVQDADAVLVCTEWPEIVNADWIRLRDKVSIPLIFDGRNCLNPASLAEAGWMVRAVGRP
ncbi:MAG: UDP-glucose dehydrogenase family protein [Planctomycetota bacterium]|jgi:UDPglucose 6-dehydrogenase